VRYKLTLKMARILTDRAATGGPLAKHAQNGKPNYGFCDWQPSQRYAESKGDAKAQGVMATPSLSPLMATLTVAIGGGVGAALRYHIGNVVTRMAGPHETFPWGTLAINVAGSLAMGVLLGWLARSALAAQTNETLRLALGVGLLGGFTTFSAFSAEMITLVHRGFLLQALGYGSASVIAGMAAFLIGLVGAQSAT
jgi:fluoride exporter